MTKKIVRFVLTSVVALCVGVAYVACQNDPPVGPSEINVSNVNTNTNIQGGGATPSPSPGACSSINSVSVLAPSSHGISSSIFADLDATPKPTRPDSCNDASPIQWSASPSATCALRGDTSGYNTPNLECKVAGTCVLAVSVKDIVSGLFVTGSANVTCQ